MHDCLVNSSLAGFLLMSILFFLEMALFMAFALRTFQRIFIANLSSRDSSRKKTLRPNCTVISPSIYIDWYLLTILNWRNCKPKIPHTICENRELLKSQLQTQSIDRHSKESSKRLTSSTIIYYDLKHVMRLIFKRTQIDIDSDLLFSPSD